jgi:MerR family transcriptional regulator, light-induced transcriptional regulator
LHDRDANDHTYLAALLSGGREQCQTCLEQWSAATPDLRILYKYLVRRARYAVGEQWEQGNVSVATEHLATAISEGLLSLSYPRLFATPRKHLIAVVASTVNEQHQLGAKMVADLLELQGWRAHFLDTCTPQSDWPNLPRGDNPDIVAPTPTGYFNLPALLQMPIAIRTAFPSLSIIAGRQTFRWGSDERVEQIAWVYCLASFADRES